MHMGKKSHRHLWLLSGTGDGPLLAKRLLFKGWKVTVSVVSSQAAIPYASLPLQNLHIGALEGAAGIKAFMKKAKAIHCGFDWVIDATHPFAQVISSNLKTVCQETKQPLIRFERDCQTSEQAILIKHHQDLLTFDLKGQRLLFAIGTKFLSDAVDFASKAGATVFARILPNVDSISKALSCNIPSNHLAILKPLEGKFSGEYEAALCRFWGITGIVSRQSGGATQKVWQNIAKQQQLDLWLISRPKVSNYLHIFHTYKELIDYL